MYAAIEYDADKHTATVALRRDAEQPAFITVQEYWERDESVDALLGRLNDKYRARGMVVSMPECPLPAGVAGVSPSPTTTPAPVAQEPSGGPDTPLDTRKGRKPRQKKVPVAPTPPVAAPATPKAAPGPLVDSEDVPGDQSGVGVGAAVILPGGRPAVVAALGTEKFAGWFRVDVGGGVLRWYKKVTPAGVTRPHDRREDVDAVGGEGERAAGGWEA